MVRLTAGLIATIALLASTIAAQSPSGKLNGIVVDTSDASMPGVSVSIRGPEQRTTTTDKDGKFAFASLPPGDYELRAALEGFSTTVRRVVVTESTEPLRIRMWVGRSAGQTAGSTRNASGVLLAGVFVEVASPALVEKYRSTNTGSDGRYRFIDLPDGAYSIAFTFPGFWSQRRENVVLTNGSTATIDATMQVGGESEPIVRGVTARPRVRQAGH